MSRELEQPAVTGAPPTPPRATPARLGYVDGLRALAALDVVAGHTAQTIWYHDAITLAWAGGLLSLDHYAVSVFIVLSGFSLTLPVTRQGARLAGGALGFYRRRARRILPPYYAALTLALLLIWRLIGQKTGRLWDLSLPVTWAGALQHVTLTNDFTGNTQVNPVFWSIALECQIYLCFPALVWLWRRYHPAFVTALTLVVSFFLVFSLELTPLGKLPGYLATAIAPQYLGLFAVGMLASWLTTRSSSVTRWLGAHRGWDVGVGLGIALFALAMRRLGLIWLDYLVGPLALCILLAAARPGVIRNVLDWRPLVWIGGFSYSLYLIHAPLIQVLWQYVFHPLGLGDVATYLALLGVGGPLIVLAAWGFWWLCERPFLNSRATGKTRAGEVYRAETRPAATP